MRKTFVTMLAVVCLAGVAAAQTQFGTITGRVTDASEAVVPGVKVTLTNLATNVSVDTTTNDEGIYVFANVLAGEYTLTTEKEGFQKLSRRVTVSVADRRSVDLHLVVGQQTQIVEVTAASVAPINTTTGELSRTITSKEVANLPLLARDPYALMTLAPGAVDTGRVTGDIGGGGDGAYGLAVSGGRTRSVNFMLDGGENNDAFTGNRAQTVPFDAVQEFKVQTNNMTAEFGRSPVTTNVITKTGTNSLHGSLYEYYRGAGLSTATFDDNANGSPKSNFVRNQFGATGGGPIIKDKTFFFGSFEGLRVRSSGNARFFVPTQDWVNAAAPNAAAFTTAFGGLPASDCADGAVTAQYIVEQAEALGPYAANPLFDRNGNPIPAGTNLFCRTSLRAPIDAGGGLAQNTWLFSGRIDHQFSPTTALLGRYAFAQTTNPAGSVSLSPFEAFNTAFKSRNQNINLTLTHSFAPTFFTETRAIYNRVFQDQPLGEAPGTVPCWTYGSLIGLQNSTPTSDPIVFPGYLPASCFGFAIPFGGPQNVYQIYEGMTWVKGRHTWKWGGQYVHLRDNRTFGAFQTGFFDAFSMQGMLDGQVDFMFLAIDPKGRFPGEAYTPATDGPFGPPSFTRHYRYNEVAFYLEDSIKVTPRLTVNLGLRWEYFGVLHSPKAERSFDANLFLDAVGSTDPTKSVFEQIRDARFSRTNNLFQQDWNNFAPRVSLAWDVFGDSRTVFRGGYGIYYDRNFGNALFNVIQNFPNYAVISQVPLGGFGGPNTPVEVNQFDTLNALLSGGSLTLSGSARMLNRDMVTAYSAQWNTTVEHDIMGKGVIASLSYVGQNGYKLYSLNNLNPIGGCLLAPSINATCDPTSTGRTSRLNQTGLTGMNRRANEGLSRYNGMNLEVRTRQLGSTGLAFNGNYTWSHSIDNASSFFGDSPFEFNFGFGFRNPFNPAADRANSTNDIRHRFAMSWNWELPWHKSQAGVAGHAFGGWTISGIWVAQTGGAFSVYDGSANSQCTNNGTNFCYPVLSGSGVPSMTATPVTGAPNTFTLYNLGTLFQTHDDFCATAADPTLCTAQLYLQNTGSLSPRNLFRTPGFWTVDLGILKDFRMPIEGQALQFRAEFFNLFNHSNLYANAGTNVFGGAGSEVLANRGVRPDGVVERRNIQLGLRYSW